MASYRVRGNAHNVVYTYWNQNHEYKQQWETYTTELEAIQRKAYIDYLQKGKRRDEIRAAAEEYLAKRAEIANAQLAETPVPPAQQPADNMNRTYQEFIENWLPYYGRLMRFSPNTYDSYMSNLKTHILPYFGDRIMSTITSQDIACFIDHLSKTRCKGSKSYGKAGKDVPFLSSATVKKCYNILMVGYPIAKQWRYVREIPETRAPAEKYKKRKAWKSEQVADDLETINENKLLHLAVHIAFVCSMRAGEVAGIDIKTIDFHDRSLWITQIVQRVSDQALETLPDDVVLKVFPKTVKTAKSSLILKDPKTDGSYRKQYLTTPLLEEIKDRLAEIKRNKEFFGSDYKDYGLLICQPDGRPVDPRSFNAAFKNHQSAMQIDEKIEFQGLRKSGQMHKVRLSNNNYQLVAESGGQSPEVLMSNYNEALETEKRTLSMLVETSFYPQSARPSEKSKEEECNALLQKIQKDPELAKHLMQLLLSNALKQS